ncbi:Sec7 domain-containing protein [Rutstroemia sp. NJR-2017a BBW]|nr:Sec7 domain-containing protein [Rutstroemia sp. NJR-2017a BBW]
MLLSLDQFSFGQEDFGLRNPTLDEDRPYSAYGDDDPYQSIQNFAARSGRGHAYSYSSDYDAADDSSRYSDQPSRSRRSNSSSNFQTGLSRISSIRNDMRGPIIPPRGLHSRAKGSSHGSKASSANSFDLGWAHNLGRRSSSFDYGSDRQAAAQARQMSITIPPHGSYDYDAAPTPTVPGGPRRPRPASPILVSRPDASADPPMEKLERKRSAKSSKSAYKGRGFAGPGRTDYGLNDRNRELPPMPAFIKDPAPAPSVAYSKTEKNAQAAAQAPKEKPGFFRRVFGSSKNSTAVVPDFPHSHGPTMAAETADHPASKTHQHVGNQVKSHHAAPSRDITPASKEHPHVLTKKPSSFFRRRKKSVSEADSLPVPAVPTIKLQPKDDLRQDIRPDLRPDIKAEISPVMNPYLHSPGRPPIEAHQPTATLDHQVNDNVDDTEGYVRGFSPKYEPNKNATIRTIKPSSSHASETRKATYSLIPQPRRSMSANFANPTGLDGQAKEDRDTFLQDSSDKSSKNGSDANSRLTATKDVLGNTLLPSPISPGPSASVMRDMALVAEYERIHSKRSPTSSTFPAKIEPPLESPQSTADSKASQERATSSGLGVIKELIEEFEPAAGEGKSDLARAFFVRRGSSFAKYAEAKAFPFDRCIGLPIVQVEGQEEGPPSSPPAEVIERALCNPSTEKLDMTPTEDDRVRAQKVFDGNEDFIQKEKAAAWMGDEDPIRSRTLIAYMELYNFTNLNILASLRVICGRLVLKGESQQVDRILDAFSKRWCQSNPNHGFKSTDVVHTICYSVLLLNTDLHLADIEQKMTRSQFVKNTMPTIRRCVTESAHEFEPSRPTVLPGKSSAFEDPNANDDNADAVSIEVEKHSWRQSFKPAPRPDPENPNAPTPLDYDTPVDDCGPLVKAPFRGTLRTWEVQVEIVLKDFYNSIRNERLPLFGAVDRPQIPAASTSTLSVFANGMLRRSPSVLSKAPSESASYLRGRTAETVRTNGKWSNKTRSRPRLYPNSGLGSSRTSLDDQSSMWSPSVASSTWSKYSLGKTQTSMSVTSFDSAFQGDYQQSIGFANALSQAIIREETVGSLGSHSDHGELQVASLLEDESLELHGAPWAKEGLVKHKHHLEALDKKAKDRNWNDTFAVIEKGYMSLFSFSTKTGRHKTKGKSSGGVVGGGNWQENAENLGSFLLRQTIASALPHPGYSKARPHVWALSLPTGAVHLFQVGTPDIVKEFVSTANYWSARLSNHPLVGGISNIEYGWSDEIVNNALVTAINESNVRPSTGGGRASMQSSLRSSMDHAYGGGVKARLPGDKILISDWSPPIQNMRSSNLMETDQLRTLVAYVQSIEEELQKHNMLRNPMLLAYSPRHHNAQKAMANWEKKSSYLLREIVKFTTYIDSLHAAEALKQKIYKEREAHRAVAERGEDECEGVNGEEGERREVEG